MWANAQHDGRPAEYRWHPLFNAAKFGWRPLLQCRSVTLPRRKAVEICWGAPNSRTDLSRQWADVHHITRTCGGGIGAEQVFFPLSIYASVAKIQPNKVVRWCRDGDFFASWISIFQRAVCSTFQTCILNLHKGHTMRRSMVDIHSATAEIRQGKKRRNQRAKI